ncbi:MAG: ABC transporter ATP-binding protein, partial [Clostridia bacterium]|nr:ABC transporter ATP-binding protein [Clostridia bacterium]
RGASGYLGQNKMFHRITVRTNLLIDLSTKLAETSYPNMEDQAVLNEVEKASMTINNNNSATEAIWETLSRILQNVLGFVIYLFLFYAVDPVLTVVILITAVIGYAVNSRTSEWGYRHREEEAAYGRRMDYVTDLAEKREALKDIRIFGMGKWLGDVFDAAERLLRDFIIRGERVYFLGDLTDLVLTVLRNGIAYFYLLRMVLHEGLSAAEFLLYFTAVSGFTNWITGILAGFFELHKFSLDINCLRGVLEMKELFKFEDGEPLEPDPDGRYEIELKNVSFRYPGAEKDTLTNINLKIKPGEKLAVVGLNGAGKTTLIKLICGFYDPTEGAVLLNGEDIRKYNRRDYYRHFSAVFQEFSVLDTDFAENVTQDYENIDEKKMEQALREADLYERITALPEGVRTHVGRSVYEDGIELSGGETQRLMLARALYKNAPVIILDEPTAALDPISEHNLYMRYNELTKGRTSVYISHRLASTRFCDRILYLADGGIAEEGTHDVLLGQNGRYAELFEIQSRYYKNEEEEEHETEE